MHVLSNTRFSKTVSDPTEHGRCQSRPNHVCAYLYDCVPPTLTGSTNGSVATSALTGVGSTQLRCFDTYE